MEQNALVLGIFQVTVLLVIGVVLWRIFRALCRKYTIGGNIRIAVIAIGCLLLSGLVLRTIVQYTVLAVQLRHQRERGDADFQAEREGFRKKGLYLSLEDSNKLQELCSPDRIIEFKIASQSFYLPWRWIRKQQAMARSVWASTGGAACPIDPVQTRELFFFPPDPEIARERDLNLFLLRIRYDEWENTWRKNHPSSAPSNPASRISYPDGGYLEDVTDEWRLSNNNPRHIESDHRVYLLQQAAAGDRMQATPVEMACSTLDPKIGTRLCSARFQYEDLTVEYTFYPKQGRMLQNEVLDLPGGPVEPDGFLRFDARVRKWIGDSQKKS